MSEVLLSTFITGAPRTKKNHGKRISRYKRLKSGILKRLTLTVPSDAHEAWHASAQIQLNQAKAKWGRDAFPILVPVHVSAIFWRHANVGDLVGYEQALGDLLEHAGIIGNDKQIYSWDGSVLNTNPQNPGISLVITT
jgi:hypothetical protein